MRAAAAAESDGVLQVLGLDLNVRDELLLVLTCKTSLAALMGAGLHSQP